jgi:hypothetical protein
MISDRLIDIIHKKLYTDLNNVEIIHHYNSIWFIDRKEKFWYFKYETNTHKLYWKGSYFANFFTFFSMGEREFTGILSDWSEKIFNCKVKITQRLEINMDQHLEEVLNYKKSDDLIS